MPHYVTVKKLESLRACNESITRFEETFGKRVRVSHKIIPKLVGKFSIYWCADELLLPYNYKIFWTYIDTYGINSISTELLWTKLIDLYLEQE